MGFLTALLALVVVLAPTPAQAARWQHVTRQDGISVSMREVRGRSFPTFRGVGIVDGSIYQVLAVLRDFRRHQHWMERCAETRLVKKINEREYVIYARTDVPWPLSDRDAVFHSTAEIDLKRLIVIARFRAVRSKRIPPRDGVVRMTDLRGHWKLRALGPNKTLVDYQVDADPKGSIPRWLAKLGTRNLPLKTLRNLREQVRKSRGWYRKLIKRWKASKY